MKKKLVLIIYLSFLFFQNAWGLSEQEKNSLAIKIKNDLVNIQDRSLTQQLTKKLNNLGYKQNKLYQAVIDSPQGAVDISTVNLLIEKMPIDVAEMLFNIATERGFADFNSYNGFVAALYEKKRYQEALNLFLQVFGSEIHDDAFAKEYLNTWLVLNNSIKRGNSKISIVIQTKNLTDKEDDWEKLIENFAQTYGANIIKIEEEFDSEKKSIVVTNYELYKQHHENNLKPYYENSYDFGKIESEFTNNIYASDSLDNRSKDKIMPNDYANIDNLDEYEEEYFPDDLTGQWEKRESSNGIYRFISVHEYLVVPLSDAAAGLSLCGPWCALLGGMVGTTEELLMHYGYIEKRYLTYGILGGAVGNIFSPKMIGVGACSGLYFKGFFEGHGNLVAPVFTLALGAPSEANSVLLLTAIVGGVVDELLDRYDIATKNPITTFVLVPMFLGTNIGKVKVFIITIFLNSFIYNDTSHSEFLGKVNHELLNGPSSYLLDGATKNYINIAKKLYGNYERFFSPEELEEHVEKNIVSLIGGQLFINWLMIEQILRTQKLNYAFEHLDTAAASSNPMLAGGIKIAAFIIPYVVGLGITNAIEQYYESRLSLMLGNNIHKKLFSQDNLLRLSNDKNFSYYIDNLNSDTAAITNLGSSLLSNAVSTSVRGTHGMGIVAMHSKQLLFYTFFYRIASGHIAQYFSGQQVNSYENVKRINSALTDLHKDIKAHSRTIIERGGVAFTEDKVHDLSNAYIETVGQLGLWHTATRLYINADDLLGKAINYYFIGKEIQQGRLDFSKRNLLNKAVLDESDLFSWKDRNLATAGQLNRALDRLINLDKITSVSDDSDQIKRVVQNKNQLILKNLVIGIGERVLASIDNLPLDMGKIYAVTGKTGCGKTSLLLKIRGIKGDVVYGKGKISYPKVNSKNPKIVMLSQQDYFPIYSTLQQVLSYPEKISNNTQESKKQREEMINLLEEMGLHRFTTSDLNLDSQQDWYMLLSGGEKKKMLLISAIIKKPDILILDEVFNGLDKESTKIAQAVIKKHLPNSLLLIVDHHATDNNFDFYDAEVHFEDAKVTSFSIDTPVVI